MPAVVFLSSDLMFSSRLAGAATALNVPIVFAPGADQLASKLTPDCRLVLIDLGLSGLDLPAAVAAVRVTAPQAKVLAFGAHVDEAALAAASAAGCDTVLTRGQFHKQYAELLRSAAAS
jgi:DNA-binding NarL/FixJ family response regulator